MLDAAVPPVGRARHDRTPHDGAALRVAISTSVVVSEFVDVGAVRAELDRLLEPRRASDAITVLGAGADDLESGRAYLAALAPGGWMVPTWPEIYGGRAASAADAAAIARALAEYLTPDLYPYLVGLHVVAPTLLALATPEQCARWLPPLATGDEIWCQLFSEPGAGSDLANVGTRAERDGDEWRLTGQKVWTSRAHYARWGLALARTDPGVVKHAGITAFAVDMGAPGVDIRPLRQMNGDAHFSEVFLDGAVVADADRIGEPGAGWGVARTALANERGGLGPAPAGTGLPIDRLLNQMRSPMGSFARRRAARPRERDAFVESEVTRLTARRARDAVADWYSRPGRIRSEAARQRGAQARDRRRAERARRRRAARRRRMVNPVPHRAVAVDPRRDRRDPTQYRRRARPWSPSGASRRHRPAVERDPALATEPPWTIRRSPSNYATALPTSR